MALAHDDPAYRYFFAEMLLCFTFVHEGTRHECCLVEYLWPSDLQHDCSEKARDKDGVNLWTKYAFPPRSSFEVCPVDQILFRPALFEPPPFRPGTNQKPSYWVLNEDIYGNF